MLLFLIIVLWFCLVQICCFFFSVSVFHVHDSHSKFKQLATYLKLELRFFCKYFKKRIAKSNQPFLPPFHVYFSFCSFYRVSFFFLFSRYSIRFLFECSIHSFWWCMFWQFISRFCCCCCFVVVVHVLKIALENH